MPSLRGGYPQDSPETRHVVLSAPPAVPVVPTNEVIETLALLKTQIQRLEAQLPGALVAPTPAPPAMQPAYIPPPPPPSAPMRAPSPAVISAPHPRRPPSPPRTIIVGGDERFTRRTDYRPPSPTRHPSPIRPRPPDLISAPRAVSGGQPHADPPFGHNAGQYRRDIIERSGYHGIQRDYDNQHPQRPQLSEDYAGRGPPDFNGEFASTHYDSTGYEDRGVPQRGPYEDHPSRGARADYVRNEYFQPAPAPMRAQVGQGLHSDRSQATAPTGAYRNVYEERDPYHRQDGTVYDDRATGYDNRASGNGQRASGYDNRAPGYNDKSAGYSGTTAAYTGGYDNRAQKQMGGYDNRAQKSTGHQAGGYDNRANGNNASRPTPYDRAGPPQQGYSGSSGYKGGMNGHSNGARGGRGGYAGGSGARGGAGGGGRGHASSRGMGRGRGR